MKMEIIGPLILSLIAGLSTVLGSLFIFIKVKKINEFITFSLSFSMGIMILISIFDLLPSSIPNILSKYNMFLGLIIVLLVFLLGYLLIGLINVKIVSNNTNLYRIGVLSMISLMLHNFPEGIAVFLSSYSNIKLGIKLCIAIMLHNIPEGIIISIPLYYSKVGVHKTILYTLLSGVSEPLGALICYIFLKNYFNDIFLSFILVFVSGLMISLSLNEILKEIKSYHKDKYIYLGIILSIFLFSITLFI